LTFDVKFVICLENRKINQTFHYIIKFSQICCFNINQLTIQLLFFLIFLAFSFFLTCKSFFLSVLLNLSWVFYLATLASQATSNWCGGSQGITFTSYNFFFFGISFNFQVIGIDVFEFVVFESFLNILLSYFVYTSRTNNWCGSPQRITLTSFTCFLFSLLTNT